MHDVYGDLAGIDLNLVLALDALLAERHVTRAAKRLGITQPAASHALGRLRELFDDPLLVRAAGGRMAPTPRADQLAPQVHKLLVELAGVLRVASFDPATARRTFRICANDYTALVLLPRLAARIARVAPGIDLWVHAFAGWPDAELAAGGIDAVIGPPRGAGGPAGRYEHVLFDDTFTCLVRAAHPLAGARLTLARYCAAQHLLISPRGTPGSLVDDALAKLGKSRRVAMAVPHFLVVPYIIVASDLVATLPSRIASRFTETLDVVARPPPVDIPRFTLALAWHERNHHDAPHRWFREQLLAVAAELRVATGPPGSG